MSAVKFRIPTCVLVFVAAAAVHAHAQVVNLSESGPGGSAFQWVGSQSNARIGASLHRADLSGDVDRVDLIVGAPGAGASGQGQVYVLFMGPTWSSGPLSSAASVIITGQSPADQFGAATAAGMVVRQDGTPPPPRDLVVSAPGAFGGRGAVYVFPGPFPLGDRRDTSAAAFRILGAANDRLGTNLAVVDIDGDNYRDIVMTAPNTGRIYVVYGAASLSGTRDLSTTTADITITGTTGSVALAGADFNADGLKDLVVGIGASSPAGKVYWIKGRARSAFPATLAITSADAQFTGVDAGDAAGTTVHAADFDGDSVSDLVVGAPNAGGPANARPGAGDAYVLFGRSTFGVSASLSASSITIHGARAGDHLAAVVSAGHIRRDAPDDLLLLAPGASTAGDVNVVYGAARSTLASVIDLASGIDRVVRGDPARSPLQGMVPMQVTGKGEDIIAASPSATPSGGTSSEGILYAALSPTLVLSPAVTTITVAQGATGTAIVRVRNQGSLSAGWTARTNTSWLTMTPASGTATGTTAGELTLTIKPGNLAPGTYHGGFTYLSNSRNLLWVDTGAIDLTVVAGTTTNTTRPTNLFGLPSDPDEGSPAGVNTPVGSSVTVVPVRDFLVRFTNVTQAGRTTVEVQPSFAGTTGVRPAAWVYTVRTTAVFSGPVTVANAYQAFTTFEDDVRMVTGSKVDITSSVDAAMDVVYGSTSSLPQTLSIVEDRRRLVMMTRAGSGSGSLRGSVTPLDFDCGDNCSAFLPGTTITFTATPASGSQFSSWSGACSGAGLTCTVTTPSQRVVMSATWTVNRIPSPAPAPKPSGGGGGSPAPSPAPAPAPAPTPTAAPVPASPVPFAPTSLEATVDGSTVILTWAAAPAGPIATTYIVEAGSYSGGADLAQVANGPSPTLVAPGVANGTYYVRVRGANAKGAGPASDEVVVAVGGGSPSGRTPVPRGLTATAVGGDVTLRWLPAAGALSSYIIEAGSAPGARNLANFSTGSNATEFHASGIGAGVYYVRVRAVSAAGVSAPSNEATLVVGNAPSACGGAASAPSRLVASVAGSTVTLSWGAAGQASSYVIEAGSRSGAADLVVSDVGNSTSLTAPNVAAGTYFVRIRARNACGMGAASNEVAVTVR
jgi:hypothetical protein